MCTEHLLAPLQAITNSCSRLQLLMLGGCTAGACTAAPLIHPEQWRMLEFSAFEPSEARTVHLAAGRSFDELLLVGSQEAHKFSQLIALWPYFVLSASGCCCKLRIVVVVLCLAKTPLLPPRRSCGSGRYRGGSTRK